MLLNLQNFSTFAKNVRLLFGLFTIAVFTACSGGSSNNNSDPSLKTGSFMQGTVSGLNYVTESQNGFTDNNGSFKYKEGESISFYIGGTQLGATVAASEAIDPMDLVPGVTIPVAAKEVKEFLRIEDNEFGEYPSLDARFELMNILMFLYSADSDKRASNGISIEETIHTVFANSDYNLKIISDDFADIYGLKRKFYEAYNAGAIDSARIIHRWKALDDFTALQGLAPQVMVVHTFHFDRDADGVADSSEITSFDERSLYSAYSEDMEYFESAEFNDYGDVLSRNDSVWMFRDIHGNLLELTEDRDGDDVIEKKITFAYDEWGNKTSISYERDAVLKNAESLVYDSSSNLIEHQFDNDADGIPDRIYSYVYDDLGQQLSYTQDNDADGTPEQITTYAYDANGNEILTSFDGDADGIPDQIYTHAYDSSGNHTFYSRDTNGDGVAEETIIRTYDEQGNLIFYATDNDGDQVSDYIRAFTYDADGNQTSVSTDNNGDGIWDRVDNFEYDSNGNLKFRSYDYDNDGNADYIRRYTYDINNNLLTMKFDTNANGVFDQIYIFHYDSDNNRIRESFDTNADGDIDKFVTYEYDEYGNQIRKDEDLDADGVTDRITLETYQMISFLGWFTYDD